MRKTLWSWLCVMLLCMTMQGPAMIMAQEAAVPPTPIDQPSTVPVGEQGPMPPSPLENMLVETFETVFAFYFMAWQEWGLQQSPPIIMTAPGLALIRTGEVYQPSACNRFALSANYPNAFYCRETTVPGATSGGVIIIPMVTMANMVSQGSVLGLGDIVSAETLPGFWPAVAILAHEFAHYIQAQQIASGGFNSYTWPNKEAEADCLAGTSMIPLETLFSAMGSPLTMESIDDIIEAFGIIGSPEPGDSHPTAEQRKLAFRQGLFATAEPDVTGGPPLNRVNISREVCFSLYKK